VRKTYGVELQPADFFKAPTVAELAALVELRLIEEIEREACATDDPHPAAGRITASFSS
jgi:hypothetical protein